MGRRILGPRAESTTRFLHLFDGIRPDVVTARYNLLSPIYGNGETDIFAFARRRNIGLIVKQALGQGLLLKPDLYALPTFSAADHRSRDPEFRDLTALRRRLAPLRDRFGDSPTELARVALRFVLQSAPDAPVLVGFRNADQIHTTLTSLGGPITHDEITEIRAMLHPTTRKEPVS
ncbi:MAG: aldo/keto reductase [Natronosporangium sp.]